MRATELKIAVRSLSLAQALVKIFIFLYCTFGIKKKSFVSESVCCSLYPEIKTTYEIESHINGSLWIYKQYYGLHMMPNGIFMLLMILAGGVELNPCPALTCCSCLKEIRLRQLKGTCQNCKLCFHIKCLKESIDDIVFCKTCYIRPAEEMTMYDDWRKDCYDNLRSYIVKSGLKILHQNVNGLPSKIEMFRICLIVSIRIFIFLV